MGLLSGLEKFGFGKRDDFVDIKENVFVESAQDKAAEQPVEKKVPAETDFLIQKAFVCPVCDNKFKAIAIRGTKLRRLEPDADLRPRCQFVDVIKYDTVVCPNCGYSAMGRYFEPVSYNQIKRLKEQIMVKFRPMRSIEKETYSYEEAIERYQLCLMSAMVKNARISERSYICLKIAWLYREMIDQLPADAPDSERKKEEYQKQYDEYYRQAYDGFSQAVMSESPPICGMNVTTVEYLLANMAVYFNDKAVAIRYLTSLITSKSASTRMKDKCRDLKDELVAT